MKWILLIFFYFNFCHYGIGQELKLNIESKDSLYNANIKKSKLYGVYIPRDIDDAMAKLMELTTEEARKPLIRMHEDTIAKKLHFGLGRWMEYNWNFAEGSRLSHLLRQKGILYVDDMTYFMLVTFHRYISKKPLDIDALSAKIIDQRKKKIKLEEEKMPVIHRESKKVIKNK
ncbi:MAG: hypothetical protein IPO92_06420 [Saprospiraceae bacterium]|nr:hypothetical protein [Saprospiraceae bacterium]